MPELTYPVPPPTTAVPPRPGGKRGRIWRKGNLAVLGLIAIAGLAYVADTLHQRFVTDLDAQIERGPFASSTNLYAAPLTVKAGLPISMAELEEQLGRVGYGRDREGSMGTFRTTSKGLEVWSSPRGSAEPVRVEFKDDQVSRVVSLRDAKPVDALRVAPELLTNVVNRNREKRRLVRYDQIPPTLVRALLAVEDKRFFKHLGFDPLRIGKAAYLNVRDGRKGQGASTLTMQLARSVWLDPDKNWRRKIQEVLISIRLEQKLGKEQILEHYCNQVYLGRRDTYNIHGFGEGARLYFGKELEQVTLPEAALLAGLIQRPSYYNPFRYPERATDRRNLVLSLMRDNGFLNQIQYQQAAAMPLKLATQVIEMTPAPYYMDLANDQLSQMLAAYKGPGSVFVGHTSLDRDLQVAAEEAVRLGTAKLDKLTRAQRREGGVMAEPQVALVALDPHTGEVKALVGGRNYQASQLNHALSMRQPGSVFKPLVYAAAFSTMTGKDPKKQITPATTVMDVPTIFKFNGQKYEPGNYHGGFHGQVTLRSALAKSMNIPAVRAAELVGYGRVVDLAQRAGMNHAIQPTPAVALGAYEATPLEVAGAYTIFANQGRYVRPTFFSRVDTTQGHPVYRNDAQGRQVLDPRVAFVMVDTLQEVVRSGTASAVRASIREPVAAKTGTSRDGWFAGFTANLLCVVWVGFDDNRELGLEGAKSALPIWTEFMKRALRRKEHGGTFEMPKGLVRVAVDSNTGGLATEDCPTRVEYFVQGSQPRFTCPGHDQPSKRTRSKCRRAKRTWARSSSRP